MRTNVVLPVWVPPPEVRPAAGLIAPDMSPQNSPDLNPVSGLSFSLMQRVIFKECIIKV